MVLKDNFSNKILSETIDTDIILSFIENMSFILSQLIKITISEDK